MEAEIFALLGFHGRQSDFRVDDAVADFVRKNVEVQRERANVSGRLVVVSDLHEAITHQGVIEFRQYDDFQALEVVPEMPFDAAPEIMLPDVQYEADNGVDMSNLKLRAARLQMVEVTVRVRHCGRLDLAVPRGRIRHRKAGPHRCSVGPGFADGLDDIHTIVSGSRPHRPGGRRNPDGLGLVERGDIRRLREHPESCPRAVPVRGFGDRHSSPPPTFNHRPVAVYSRGRPANRLPSCCLADFL